MVVSRQRERLIQLITGALKLLRKATSIPWVMVDFVQENPNTDQFCT
ncbi:hypothetical protein [Synechococcus sp. M16CYN]